MAVAMSSLRRGAAALACLLVGMGLLVGIARAQPAAPPFTPLPASEAAQWLRRIQQAAHRLDYCGVATHQQGSDSHALRIIHVLDATGERERVELLDGAPHEWLRHNEQVERLWPERRAVVREARRSERFPGLLSQPSVPLAELFKHYQLHVRPDMQRLAGRRCRQMHLVPRDARRYGYRLCVDAQTNLLLQKQTLAADGSVVEQTAFTTLQLGRDVDVAVLASPWPKAQWPVYEHDLKPVSLAARGWAVRPPAGFVTQTVVSRRPWRAAGDNNAGSAADNDRDIVQILLSDGLATISVFIEPALPDADPTNAAHRVPLQGASRHGALNAWGARIAGHWLTGVGEVPGATLKKLIESTQYTPPPGAQ